MNERPKRKSYAEVKQEEQNGLICPRCSCRHFYVYRTKAVGEAIRRERVCRNCNGKIVTHETQIQ